MTSQAPTEVQNPAVPVDVRGNEVFYAHVEGRRVPIIGTEQLEVRDGLRVICTVSSPVFIGESTTGALMPGFNPDSPDVFDQLSLVTDQDPINFSAREEGIVGGTEYLIFNLRGEMVGKLSRFLYESEVPPMYD